MKWWLLKRKVHSSWLIAWLSIGFIVGIFLAQFFVINFWWVLFGIVLLPIIFYKSFVGFLPLLIMAGVIFGNCRGGVLMSEIDGYDKYLNQEISVVGEVQNISSASGGLRSFSIGDLRIDEKHGAGQIYVTAEANNVKNGDYVEISGLAKPGFGRYVLVIYRAKILNHQKTTSLSGDFRENFGGQIKKVLPGDQASLGIGFLLGEKTELSADFAMALQLAGITHIVVASGYNLTILVRLARRIFIKVSKYMSLLMSLIMISCFIFVAGASPSMVRAGMVSVLSLIAWYYGRKFHPIVLLILVAAITLMFDPSYLWADIGWQLSFSAFAGVMIIAPLMTRYFFGDSHVKFLPQLLIETISAQIATMPILIVYFGQISNVAIIANLLVLPLVPLAMLLVFVCGVATSILPALGGIMAIPASWLLGYMINVINFFANLPWAISLLKFDWVAGGVMYCLIILACFYMRQKTGLRLREVNIVE